MSSIGAAVTRLPLRRIARGRQRGWLLPAICGAFIGLWVLLAVFAPLVSPADPKAVNLLAANAGSSAAHLLGTDDSGRETSSPG